MSRQLPRRLVIALRLLALGLLAWAVFAVFSPRLYRSQVQRAALIAEFLKNSFDVYVGEVDGPGCAWRSQEELEWTSQAVNRIAATVGGPPQFKATMHGPVVIVRVPVPEVRAFAPPDELSAVGDIFLTDYNFDHGKNYAIYLIVHEMGHVLDWRSRRALSGDLEAETGAARCQAHAGASGCDFDVRQAVEPAPGDPDQPYAAVSSEEYWAEVFASYAYPDYYAGNARNNSLGPQTTTIVEHELAGLRRE